MLVANAPILHTHIYIYIEHNRSDDINEILSIDSVKIEFYLEYDIQCKYNITLLFKSQKGNNKLTKNILCYSTDTKAFKYGYSFECSKVPFT